MAQVSYIDLPTELDELYFSGLQVGDRFTFARVGRKNSLLSKRQKKGISQRSLLPEISALWAGLSTPEKEAWSEAGLITGLNGWKLFVQDVCARRVNDLSGLATPSIYHQSWVGQVNLSGTANEALLIQQHPRTYYVNRKVPILKNSYSPVLITEPIELPLEIEISYSSDLTSTGPESRARFYAEIWYSYQGQNLMEKVIIDLDLESDWQTAVAVSPSIRSIVVGYDLYIDLYNVQGSLYFDNIKATHSGQNWMRDTYCKDINQGFTRNFYQIPKHWSAIIAPNGLLFETIYKDF